MHGDKVFSILKNRKRCTGSADFLRGGALTVQLTFLLTIERIQCRHRDGAAILCKRIIVRGFALARRTRPGHSGRPTAILTSLIGTFLLVTHGNQHRCQIAGRCSGIASHLPPPFSYDTAFRANR